MKRKFINLLLAVVFLMGSAQMLTSCKDNMEDVYAQLRDDNLTLEKALKAEIEILKGQINALEGVTNDLKNKVNDLQNQINNLDEKYVSHAEFNGLVDQYIAAVSDYNTLKDALDALKKVYDEVQDAHGDYNTIGERFAAIEAALVDYKARIETLEGKVGNLETIVGEHTTQIEALNEFKNEWTPKLLQMQTDIAKALEDAAAANALAAANKAEIDAIWEALANIKQCECGDIKEYVDNKYTEVINYINTQLENYATKDDIAGLATTEALNQLAEKLNDYATKQDLSDAVEALNQAIDDLRQEAADNLAAVESALQDQISVIEGNLSDLTDTVGDLADAIAIISDDIENLKDKDQDLQDQIDALGDKIDGLQDQIDAINDKIDELQDKVDANTTAIGLINDALANVFKRLTNLENRISSIVIQGAENPVYGYFNTPFGVSNNMLVTYYGENTNPVPVTFPNTVASIEYNSREGFITDEDLEMIQLTGQLKTEKYVSGARLMDDNDANLGKVYLTLNPANIDLDGKTLTLVNSQDQDSKVELRNIKPSDKELTFGYTRTETSANGFYEADAYIDPAKATAIKINIEPGLKSAAKDLLESLKTNYHGEVNYSLIHLGNTLYDQFNGILPALGIKAAWVEDEYDAEGNKVGTKNQAVYSQYGIAATTFKPLSFRFLLDKSFPTIPIPDLGKLLNFNFNASSLNIDLSKINVKVDCKGLNYDLNLNLVAVLPTDDQLADISFLLTGLPTSVTIDPATGNFVFSGNDGEIPVSADVTNLRPALEAYVAATCANLSAQAQAELIEAFNNAMYCDPNDPNYIDTLEGRIKQSIEDAMADAQALIDETIDDVLGKVNNKVDDIVNKITDNKIYSTLESVIKRFNCILNNPNYYLQTAICYHNGTQWGKMSDYAKWPTQFKTNGGNAAILAPTTLTAQIFAPVFRKFIAVTNVFKTDDPTVSAKGGDATCKNLVKQSNSQPLMCEIIPGTQRTVPFYFEGGQGYTYEFLIQAIDFSGITSTSKHYVAIK